MGCCGSHTSGSVGGGCEMDHLYKSGNTLEIFRGPRSFKLFVTKHDAFQSKIHIPQMWLEAQHCVVHATGDLKVSVDGVRVDIPESRHSSKLNDLMMSSDEISYSSSQEPCISESHEIGCLEVIPDWLKPCKVTEFHSDQDFHITLEEHKELREEMYEILLDTVTGPLKQFPRSYAPGTHVILAHNDTNPCRGVLGESLSASTVVVKLLDTGKETIADLKMLSVLPSKASFIKYPPQAIRCSLRKNTFNKLDKNYLNRCALKGTVIRVHFGMFLDGIWQVSLLANHSVQSTVVAHTDANEVKSTLNYLDLNRLMQEELQVSDKVKTSHIDNENGFVWIQRIEDFDDLRLLEQLASDNSASAKIVECHEVGQLYLCQSPVDSIFRRGLALSKVGALIEVIFIDHGRTEFIPKSNVRVLPSSMKGFPRLSYCCVLSRNSMNKIEQFRKKELEVKKCNKTDFIYQIKVHYQGLNLSAVKTEVLQKEDEEELTVPEAQFSLNSKVSLKISHIDTDGSLWFQLKDNIDKLNEIMSKIAVSEGHVGSILESKFCCSKYPLDDNWYRAQMSRVISNEEVEIFYIDYGNKETANSQQLKMLPEHCSELPMQAIHCWLHNEDTDCVFQGADIAKHFQESDVIEGEFIRHDKFGLVLTKASVDGRSLISRLADNDTYAPKTFFTNASFECLQISELALSSQEEIDFEIVHVDDDASVWIRLDQYRSDYNDLESSLQEANFSELCRLPVVGEFYLCNVYGTWARCVISTVNNNLYCDVRLVDSGESRSVFIDNMAILPKNLSKPPRQAVRCVLSCLSGKSVDSDLLSLVSTYERKLLRATLKVDMVVLSLENIYEGSVLVEFQEENSSQKDGWGNSIGWNVPDSNTPVNQNSSLCNGTYEVRPPPRKCKVNQGWKTPPKQAGSSNNSVSNSPW